MSHAPDDRCKCTKPEGAWGQGRWHHVIIDAHGAENMAAAEYRRVIGESGPMTYEEKTELWEQLKPWYKSYIGTKMAYEECPEGLAHIQDQCHEEAQRRMTEGAM